MGKVIVLSAYEQYLSDAIAAGAAGYMVKGAKAQELTSTIRRVQEGEGFVFGASVMDTPRGQEAALGYLA